MKRYISSTIKFHPRGFGGFRADNNYTIEKNGSIGGMNIYVVRDSKGKVIERVGSLAEAKQIIINIAEGRG